MGLAARVIPVLLQRGTSLVKGEGFASWRSVGHTLQAAKIHAARKVDELIYLDIGASPSGKHPNFDLIVKMTEEFFSPITVGGGIRSIGDVERLLKYSGADKVSISTAVVERPEFIDAIVSRFGSQALVVCIDYHQTVTVCCGTVVTTLDVIEWAKEVADRGAGEIMLNCTYLDGTMKGYDLKTIEQVSRAVSVPVIACGGAGSYKDMEKALKAGASAVAAGAMFQFSDQTPRGACEYLDSRGFEVRL